MEYLFTRHTAQKKPLWSLSKLYMLQKLIKVLLLPEMSVSYQLINTLSLGGGEGKKANKPKAKRRLKQKRKKKKERK